MDSTAAQGSGVPSVAGSHTGSDDSATTNAEKVIRVGDTLLINFSNLPGTPRPAFDQRVRDDGTITLIYNSVFQAAGKKTGDLEKEIRDYYVPVYRTNLTVAVHATSGNFVYVDGEFRSPGRYAWTNGMRLKDAIEAAGGLTDFARHKVSVIHLDGTRGRYRLVGDWVRTNNPALKAEDRILNPRELL